MSELERREFARRYQLTEKTLARLDLFESMLCQWNTSINLVSAASLAQFWNRHVLDSVQLLTHAGDNVAKWVDLGTGGGFPGLVVGIAGSELWPEMEMACIESDRRKATFLSAVSRETNIGAKIIQKRIEVAAPQAADVVSARALAPLPKLLGLVNRHLAPGGKALLLKGARYQEELAAALDSWRFTVQIHPSVTNPDAAVICLGDIQSV